MLQISLFTRLTRRCIATLLAPRFALPLIALPLLSVSPGAAAKDLVDVPVGLAPTLTSSAMLIAKEKAISRNRT
jgi:hypothetical protein